MACTRVPFGLAKVREGRRRFSLAGRPCSCASWVRGIQDGLRGRRTHVTALDGHVVAAAGGLPFATLQGALTTRNLLQTQLWGAGVSKASLDVRVNKRNTIAASGSAVLVRAGITAVTKQAPASATLIRRHGATRWLHDEFLCFPLCQALDLDLSQYRVCHRALPAQGQGRYFACPCLKISLAVSAGYGMSPVKAVPWSWSDHCRKLESCVG